MAVVSVPRPLRDQLGDAAADSLVDMLRNFEDDQEQQRAIQKEHLLEVLDERFLRHLAETEERLHEEIGTLRRGGRQGRSAPCARRSARRSAPCAPT